VIDLVTGRVRVTGFEQEITHQGDFTLVERNAELGEAHRRLVLLEPNGERDFGEIEEYPSVLVAGAFVYVDPLVVDLATGTLVGQVPMRQRVDRFDTTDVRGVAMAIASDGRILVGTPGMYSRRYGFPLGPLEWIKPVAP
jgi:hypothetical protein